jgi:SAM-dependent methyltransferase
MRDVATTLMLKNKAICDAIERYLPHAKSNFLKEYEEAVAGYMNALQPPAIVVDVGGGRKCDFAGYRDTASGVRIIAVDISEDELAKNHDVDEKRVADVTKDLPFKTGEVDMVVSHSLFEHLRDSEAFVVNSSRVLKPGGYFIHLFASKFAPFAIANQLLPAVLSKRLLKMLKPEATRVGFDAYYDRTYASATKRLLIRHGFEIVSLKTRYYQSRYWDFFVPLFLMSVLYELAIYAIDAQDLAASVLVVATKR